MEGDDRAVIADGWASILLHVYEIAQIIDEEEAKKAADDLVRASIKLMSGIK